MRKTKYMKKAARGLQDVAVPQQGSTSDVLSSTTTMASAGSQFGPWGALAGGVLGLGAGLFNKSEQDEANKRAIETNKYLKSNREVEGVDESIDQKKQVYKKGTKMIEIEGKKTPEIHTDKNFNVKNLGTTPHSKGGNKVEASEGDIVFNTQNSLAKYNKIATAIENGDMKTLKKEKNKLPEDSGSKAQDGKRVKNKSKKSYREAMASDLTQDEVDVKRGYGLDKPRTRFQQVEDRADAQMHKPAQPKRLTNYQKVAAKANQEMSKRAPTTFKDAWDVPNIDNSPVRPFDFKTPLAIPGINPSSNSVIPKVSSQSPVNKQGKRISGSTTKLTPTQNTLATLNQPIRASIGDGSDLSTRENSSIPESVSDVLSPKKGSAAISPTTSTDTLPTTPQSNTANNLMQLTGVANNLFQGLKADAPINEKYFDPKLNKYVDRSEALRQQSISTANIQNTNARNVSGGNAANLRATQQQAALGNLGRQDAINEQEISRRDAIEAQNVGLLNQAGQYNLQRKDAYESQYRANRLAKQEYLDTAASDIGQLGMAKQEEAYLRSRDDKAEAAQLAGYRSINGRYQHKSNLDGSPYFEPDADSTITRYGLPKLPSIFGDGKKKKVGYAKGTKSVKTSKYKMK